MLTFCAHVIVSNLLYNYVHMHISRKHMQWLCSVGVANKGAQFVALMGPAERHRKQFFTNCPVLISPSDNFSCRQQ